MTDYTTCSAGIDVAKAKLDIALHPGGQYLVVDYTAEGLKTLDRFLRQHGVARVGFEASGGSPVSPGKNAVDDEKNLTLYVIVF